MKIHRSSVARLSSLILIGMATTGLLVANPTISPAEDKPQKPQEKDALSPGVDQGIQAFLKRSGQDALLSRTTSTEAKAPTTSELETNQNTSETGAVSTNKSGEKPAKTIRINFDGGMFFDNEAGTLVYLKNIRLDETSSDFKLRCSEELKLLFDKQPDKNKETEPGDDKQADPTKKKKDKSFAELGDLREIIATGNVRIAGKNTSGKPFLASGEVASYHAENGEMILKGGRPTLQQTANQYLQAQEDGQWIKIQMKDKDIVSISTSEGKWETQAVIEQNPLSQ
ncbi:MAG: hypothetical protein ACPIG6_08015 [Akkermansiaceae bacterium]